VLAGQREESTDMSKNTQDALTTEQSVGSERLPPKSLTPALLLATAAVLHFQATSRDKSGSVLGVLSDTSTRQHLAISADGAWMLSGPKPASLAPVLVYESAANVLRGGSLNPDGSIAYQGGTYVIEPLFDGRAWTARVRGSS
jgi:hypothetical protein